jgi:hypothetical protein
MDCVAYSSTLRVCRQLCIGDSDCPSGSMCAGTLVCGQGNPPLARFCQKLCQDVTARVASTCGAGFKCDVGCNGEQAVTSCVPAGIVETGPCEYNADCAPGFSCVAGGCRQSCVTTGDCTLGGACVKQSACGSTPSGFHYCG